jgi:peroxin-1
VQILATIVKQRLHSARSIQLDESDPLNYAGLASQTEGYSATDLQDLVTRAIHQVAIRSSNLPNGTTVCLNKPCLPRKLMHYQQATLSYTDFAKAQKDFVPLSLRDVPLQKSDVTWADIGGEGRFLLINLLLLSLYL